MFQTFIVRIAGAKVINSDGAAKRAQRFKILPTGVRIREGLLFGHLNSYKFWRDAIALKQRDNLPCAVLLHQSCRQQVDRESLAGMLMEHTEQGLQHEHVKTLAEVKLHNQRNESVGHNDAIATAHAREDLMITLPLRILNRLRIEHQRAIFEHLLDAHKEAHLLGSLIHHQILLLVQRQHPTFTARLFGKPA